MRRLIIGLFVLLVAGAAGYVFWPRPAPQLILYTDLDYSPAVVAAFDQQTGIKIAQIRLSAGALLARIGAEGHHPAWNIAWFDGETAAASLDHAGLLSRHLPPPSALTRLGQDMLGPDGAWVPTGFTLAGVFITAPATIAPTGWQALAGPDWHDGFAMNDPAVSGPAYPTLAGMLEHDGGWPAGQDYLAALKRNGMRVYAKNNLTLAALKNGVIRLAIVQSSAAINASLHDRGKFRVTYPRPAYVLPSVMVMAAGLQGPRKAAAERFMRFVMRPDIQRMRMRKGGSDGYFWPITTNAPPTLAGLPALADLDPARLDATSWGDREAQVTRWFARAIAGQ